MANGRGIARCVDDPDLYFEGTFKSDKRHGLGKNHHQSQSELTIAQSRNSTRKDKVTIRGLKNGPESW